MILLSPGLSLVKLQNSGLHHHQSSPSYVSTTRCPNDMILSSFWSPWCVDCSCIVTAIIFISLGLSLDSETSKFRTLPLPKFTLSYLNHQWSKWHGWDSTVIALTRRLQLYSHRYDIALAWSVVSETSKLRTLLKIKSDASVTEFCHLLKGW